MDGTLTRALRDPEPQQILEDLTTRQHLKPHQSVARTLSETASAMGLCVEVAERAAQWLQLDPSGAVGRLRRTQLTQLARCIHRFWRRATRATPGAVPAGPSGD